MEALPEPYGKWFQHVEQRPRWGERVKLRLRLSYNVTPLDAASTRIDLRMSSFAPTVALMSAERLAIEFDLDSPGSGAGLYAESARFLLAGTPVDLRGLR